MTEPAVRRARPGTGPPHAPGRAARRRALCRLRAPAALGLSPSRTREHEALDDPLTGVTSPLNFALHTDLAGPPVTTNGILVTFTDDDGEDILRFTADVTHDGNADTLTIAIRQPRVRESGVWVNPFFPNSCVGQSEAPEGFILSGRVAPTCEF